MIKSHIWRIKAREFLQKENENHFLHATIVKIFIAKLNVTTAQKLATGTQNVWSVNSLCKVKGASEVKEK